MVFLSMTLFVVSSVPGIGTIVCGGDELTYHDLCYQTDGMTGPLIYEVLLCSCVSWNLLNWASRYTTTSTTTAFQVVNAVSCAIMSSILCLVKGTDWAVFYGLQPPGPHLYGIAFI